MKQLLFRTLPIGIVFLLSQAVRAQVTTQKEILQNAAKEQASREKLLAQQLHELAAKKGWPLVMKGKNGDLATLVGIDAWGMPQYYSTQSNIIAAATIGTNKLWPGGSLGIGLNGSSPNVKDKLALWDGGLPRITHVELNGRITVKDGISSISDHSTHVAGTLIGAGVNPQAKGMSFGMTSLPTYDYTGDASEMLGAASGLLVSNHSYGNIAGWYYHEELSRWEWWGRFDATEDYKLGYYSAGAQLFDSIAYNAPNYLIVIAASNKRNENGPAVGENYWRFDASNEMSDAGARPAGISNNDSYDILPPTGTAKNVLTVGAVNPVPAGYSRPQDVTISSFSSWGPTDDGRIKPDVVTDGVGVLSSIGTADNAYASYSGTSMATPSASGSALLLQEYYSSLHAGAFMRAATLKGLIIHTADEAGASPGPDYQYGWGLMNTARAAEVIKANNTTDLIQENSLNNAATFSIPVVASGNGKLTATISWTDPKSTVIAEASALDNTTKRLVNDLDIVIKKGATVYRPWVMNPAVPDAAATTGDNTIDNVEKIEIADVIPGDTYTIEITHKGVLQRGSQAYSLIVSGVGSQALCVSAPGTSAGAKIDSVSIGNIQNKNVAGCTSYSNFTSLTASLQPGISLPVFVRLRSCDAGSVAKIVKVYVDGNNDGDFTDAGENVATSAVINGDGDFTGSITLPSTLTQGKYTILRLVMVETNTASAVTPCGVYTKGETQDYRILVAAPSTDVGITEIINPQSGNCASGDQYITVRVKNFGDGSKSNIPVTVTVKQGAATVATISGILPGPVTAGSQMAYTLQTPFVSTAGGSYTIEGTTSLAGDQAANNDKASANVTIAAAPASPTGTAAICSNTAILNATNVTAGATYLWYTSPTVAAALTSGVTASTTTIPADKTYYLAKGGQGHVGLTSKNLYPIPGGGYQAIGAQAGNYMNYTSQVPLMLESVRLFTKYQGSLTIIIGDVNTTAGTYTILASKTIDLYPTNPNPAPGAIDATAADAADLGAVFYVDLSLPQGSHSILLTSSTSGTNLFRNNNVTGSPYPFTLPGLISITGNSATLATDPNYYQNFYYYLYDWKVKTADCLSGRTAIVATQAVAPVITQSGNVLTSNAASGNQWYNGTSPISGATGQSYTATTNGTYHVQVTDAVTGCVLESNSIAITTTAVPNVDPAEIGMTVSPNPASGQFIVKLETTTKADLNMSLINTAGQPMYEFKIPGFIGKLTKQVNPGPLASGVYYLKVYHDKKMYIRKVIITQ